ncbi:hypothetical protein [Pseudoalteromonas sp. R3]|uniref:hypothetical protein n=1 Tax=Pseudoalteromonas sp. R3 TaxID=1709477 RepID=UPI0006B4EFDA|nr:hypothetical protein [Pseudoalteromonas sp. R3]AZZ97883.1 hypothetical protein ELR70_12660 [Pseudoalteromonas sp. R3]
MKLLLTFSIVILLMLSGCGGDDDAARGDKNTPGYAATVFFDALYNKKDMELALSRSTPRMGRIMRSYGTPSQFARNLVNMQYDQVTIEVDMTNQSLREQYGNEARINLIFTGMLHGEQVDDMRSVQLIRRKGEWYVDKINADPFAR